MSTENIVSKKYRILSDVANKVWDVISFFTLAKDVETTNGNNLETTCGSITGITSSLTSTSTTMAASASAIKELNDKIADLNSNLIQKNNGQFYVSTTGVQSINVGFIPSVFIYQHASNSYEDDANLIIIYDKNKGKVVGGTTGAYGTYDVLRNQEPTSSNRLSIYDNGEVKIYTPNMNRFATWTAVS